MNLDTYEIQLDATGQEAVQQTLDALGVKAGQVNAAAAGASALEGSTTASNVPPGSVNLSRVEALLERIAAAVERQNHQTQPVY